ncbi:MAG TPA: DUF6744 family protein [Kribbella sp.]
MNSATPAPNPSGGPGGSLGEYLASMESQSAPLLGYLVLYSIFDSQVTPSDFARWFTELDLAPEFVPPPLRPVDAFERVTGPAGPRITYPLDGKPLRGHRDRSEEGAPRQLATLMVRHVSRRKGVIVRHIVREVRDERANELSYVSKLGECVFTPDPKLGDGAGTMALAVDRSAITKLPPAEQAQARGVLTEHLAELDTKYQHGCTYLSGDRIRAAIRDYIESLGAIRVRPTGGVYFVERRHADTLAGLHELASRCGDKSHLARIPLPDQDEMRDLVIAAWRNKVTTDLQRLSRDIAAAIATAKDTGLSINEGNVQALVRRFQQLQTSTTEHSDLLNTALDEEQAALQAVNLQIASLLTQATG